MFYNLVENGVEISSGKQKFVSFGKGNRGLWEVLHNPDFKRIEFDAFKEDAGTNAYVFSIKEWTDALGAIGLFTKSGRYDCIF